MTRTVRVCFSGRAAKLRGNIEKENDWPTIGLRVGPKAPLACPPREIRENSSLISHKRNLYRESIISYFNRRRHGDTFAHTNYVFYAVIVDASMRSYILNLFQLRCLFYYLFFRIGEKSKTEKK